MAGGLRRGAAQAEIGVDRRRRRGCCVTRAGSSRVGSTGRQSSARLDGNGHCRERRSRDSMRMGGTVTPGLIDPHTHSAVRRHAPGGGRAPPARPQLPRDTGRRRRHPADGARDARRAGRSPARECAALAGRDAQPRRDDGRGQIRLRPERGRRAAPSQARGHAGAGRAAGHRAHIPRRACDCAGVPWSRRCCSGVHGERHRRAAAAQSPSRASPRSCDVFCERGVFDVDMSRRLLTRAQRAWPERTTPRRSAQRHRRRGARGGSWRPLRRPPGRRFGKRHRGARRRRGQRSAGGRDAAADQRASTSTSRTIAPARALDRTRRSGRRSARTSTRGLRRPRTRSSRWRSRFTGSDSRAAEAIAAMTINAAAALGLEQTHGSLEEGKHADLVVGSPTRTRCCPIGWARTWSTVSSAAGRLRG